MKHLLVVLAITLGTVPASADPNAWMPHVNAGLEVMGGDGATLLAGRAHLGISRSAGRGTVRPSLALGATLAAGYLDPDATTSELSGYTDLGPELQLGLRIGNGGLVDNRVFASAAYLGSRGTRLSIGASIADFSGRVGRREAHGYVLLVLPQQIELGWTRDGTTDRFGVTLSYGL